MLIVSGPNMGGKSTYLRSTALTILLAHIGCCVPCTSATVPLFDSIYTRVGAHDVQHARVSTFMCEMQDASVILEVSGWVGTSPMWMGVIGDYEEIVCYY